jgi:hypothetical protein
LGRDVVLNHAAVILRNAQRWTRPQRQIISIRRSADRNRDSGLIWRGMRDK